MIYLRSVRLDKEELPAGFPFDIPCIRTLESLDFTHPLTFFVGENGCGKSTLLEAIACGMKTPAIGSADVSQDPSLEAQRQLARHLKFTRNTNPRIKLFFRAEDSFGFTRKIQGMLDEFSAMEGEFEAEIKGEYGLQLAKGVVQGQAKSVEQNMERTRMAVPMENPSCSSSRNGSIPRDSTCSMNWKPRFHRSIR